MTSRFGGRGAERLGGAIELALLDLGALELHEDALVLDRAQDVARGLARMRLLFVAGEGVARLAIDDEHAARLAVLEQRRAQTPPIAGFARVIRHVLPPHLRPADDTCSSFDSTRRRFRPARRMGPARSRPRCSKALGCAGSGRRRFATEQHRGAQTRACGAGARAQTRRLDESRPLRSTEIRRSASSCAGVGARARCSAHRSDVRARRVPIRVSSVSMRCRDTRFTRATVRSARRQRLSDANSASSAACRAKRSSSSSPSAQKPSAPSSSTANAIAQALVTAPVKLPPRSATA